MAAFDFPNSPSNGQTYSANGIDWIYNGNVWKKDATAGVKGQKGEIGVGDKGEKGEKGQKGEVGEKGTKGEIGATGGTGGTGQKGQKGQDGNDATGTKGQKGEKGEIGPQGGSGGTGDKGQKGQIGADGGSGADGDKGQKGEVGSNIASVPSGGIILWSGTVSNIPSGWYLCDGNNSTPDLRNKFIIGAHSDSDGQAKTTVTGSSTQSGGSKDATLVQHSHTFSGSSSHSHTINNHTHTFSGSGSSSHTHGIPKGRGGSQASISHYVANTTVEQTQGTFATTSANVSISISGTSGNPSDRGTDSQSVSISGTTNSPGSSATNANLPPYYALCYIMKS